MQILMQFRTGWHHLEVHRGRMQPGRLPRAQRRCQLCSLANSRQVWRSQIYARVGSNDCIEDLKHFVLECPAYEHIRQQNTALFAPPEGSGPYSHEALRKFFAAANQAHAANTLHRMRSYRMHLLGQEHNISSNLEQPTDFLTTPPD